MEFSKKADVSTLEGWKGEKQELGKGSSWEESGGAVHSHAPTQKPQTLLAFAVNILTIQPSKHFVGKGAMNTCVSGSTLACTSS